MSKNSQVSRPFFAGYILKVSNQAASQKLKLSDLWNEMTAKADIIKWKKKE